MIIIAGHTIADTETRDRNIEAFTDMIAKARRQDGCIDFAISPDPVDPERTNVFECWRDEAALSAWRKIAKARPHTAPRTYDVKLYRSEGAEDPFPARKRKTAR